MIKHGTNKPFCGLALLLALLLPSVAFAKTASIVGVVQDQSGGTSAPKVQALSFPAGETSTINGSLTHPDGTAYNLTGGQVLLTVGGAVISRQATIDNAAAGTFHFPIVIADTVSMLGTYSYDIWVTDSAGNRYQAVPTGSFVVTSAKGQPNQPVTVPATQQPLAQGPAGLPGYPDPTGHSGAVLTNDGTNVSWGAVSGSGTVTSVGMTVPSFMSVNGSPVTTAGTLAVSLANESANTVMCGPSSGPAAAPTFRSLVAADIPSLPESQITNLVSDLASKGTVSSVGMSVPSWLSVSGSPVTSSGTLAVSAAGAQTANEVLATPNGASGAVGLRSLVAADIPALPESQITNLTSDLAGKVPTTRTLTAGTGIATIGDLSADRTISVASTVPVCTPTTVGDYCGWNGSTWVREPAPGGASTGNFTFSANTMDLSGAATESLCGTTATACAMSPTSTATTNALTVTSGAVPTTGSMIKATDGTHDIELTVQASSFPAVKTSGGNLAFFNSSTSGLVAASAELDFYASGSNKVNITGNGVVPAVDSSTFAGDSAKRFIAGYFGAAVGSQTACDANHRGATMTVFAASGASDTFQVCMKAAADTYAWRTVFTAP